MATCSSNVTFDIGAELDPPVPLDCFDPAPLPFNGAIGTKKITYRNK